jgi:hypothetical protein
MLALELRSAGETLIWAAAVAGAVTVLVRLRPVRWLGRTTVRDPIVTAFRREVTDVVRSEVPAALDDALRRHPLTNGWGTDAVQKIADRVGADVAPPTNPTEP